MARIRLDRAALREIVGDNAKYIRAFEEMFADATITTPDQIAILLALVNQSAVAAEDAAGNADSAARAAQDALQAVGLVPDYGQRVSELEQLAESLLGQVLAIPEPKNEQQGVFTAVAGENIAATDLVNVYDDAGTVKIRRADADASQYEAVGFVEAAYSTGAVATVQTVGVIRGLSGLTVGAYHYLSDVNPGDVTATAPTTVGHIVQSVGIAVSTSELSFNPVPGIIIV